MDIPVGLFYTNTDEWIRKEDDGSIVVGVTDYAQTQLGEVVYVDLPDINEDMDVGDDVCVVESVKAASDIYMPVAGMIIEVNFELQDMTSCVNSDPYGDGWLMKIKPHRIEDCDQLMSPDDYKERLSDLDNE
jgi:glycine cleavage system H protein